MPIGVSFPFCRLLSRAVLPVLIFDGLGFLGWADSGDVSAVVRRSNLCGPGRPTEYWLVDPDLSLPGHWLSVSARNLLCDVLQDSLEPRLTGSRA